MPAKISLTKKAIEALPVPEAGRAYHYDNRVAGLAICVTASGAKSFYLYRWSNGKPTRVRIASWPDITVEQARDRAEVLNAELAQGGDPQARKRAARIGSTLGDLFDCWLEHHGKPHLKTWGESQRIFKNFLGDWKGRRLDTITSGEVQALHTRLGKEHGHYAANRLRALLHTLFAKAGDVGFAGANPVAGVQKFREKSRERFLQGDEMPRFFAALEAEPSETIRDCIVVALLTGARKGNVLTMRWEELQLDVGIWSIPEQKNGERLTLPLGAEVVEILTRRKAASDREWVFPGRRKSGHLVNIAKNWQAVLKRAGIADLHIHDLRRTLGSWQAATGASLPIIGKSLGHKSASATMIYARLNLDPVRQSVGVATAAIMAAAKNGTNGTEGASNGEAKTES
ncbi:MAG TPA: tyrosine-type recombinase/integrase [Pirellulales bacterium]|nr:tyrosine-type recombinase/integrase [Pirellulales bacterium]